MNAFEIDLFGEKSERVVNVASVPQRSPFRYPGGKTWLVPVVRKWLIHANAKNKELIEPFAGGGIISLTGVFEDLVKSATMVEIDLEVASVWQAIFGDYGKKLADRITSFELSSESLEKVLKAKNTSVQSMAFATILKNRVSHGGILANGAGLIKNGENGKGIHSRWYPATLSRRILGIVQVKDRLSIIHGDAFDVLKKNAARTDAVYFIDPPYTVAGKRLYNFNEVDHSKLFEFIAKLKGDFLVTYDNADEIRDLASTHGFKTRLVPMKNTHHATKSELLIGSDFRWLK